MSSVGYPIQLTRVAKELHRPALMRRGGRNLLDSPPGRREAQGWFSLKAPYGVLVVRREETTPAGVAERNGTRFGICLLDPAYSIRDSYSTIILTRRRARAPVELLPGK